MSNNAVNAEPKSKKAQQTSLRIQLAAVDLVLEHGVDSTTVEQICNRAGVSQRTFFNHFKTKELAIIGDDLPSIDEAKARAFLAAPPGDLFTESLQLISMLSPETLQPTLMFKRLEMMSKYPELFALNLGKLMSVRAEHMELILMRLRRNAPAGMTEDEVRNTAAIISELAASFLRASLEQGLHTGKPPVLQPMLDVGAKLAKIVEIGRNS